METSGSTGKIFNALLIGALAGAVVGILFAPDKGSRTRRKLMRKAEDLKDDLQERITDEVGALRSKVEELEGIAEDIVDDLKGTIKVKKDVMKNHG